MKHSEVVAAIRHGRPDVPFLYKFEDGSADVADLSGLEWPADAAAPRPQLATVQGWAGELAASSSSSSANEEALRGKADAAIATLEGSVAGWAALTAAQKDATLKLTVRVVIALARLVLRRFDSAGA